MTFGKEQNNFISLPDKLDQGEPARVENTRALGVWNRAHIQTQADENEKDKLRKERNKIVNIINYVKDNA